MKTKPFLPNSTIFAAVRILLTIAVATIAAVVLWHIVQFYTYSPWTRDGHLQADIVEIAPDVSGLISQVEIGDNQPVHRGQVLFVIDQARYKLALDQARATQEQRAAVLAQARREVARNRSLGDLVARETSEESVARLEEAQAQLDAAQVAVRTAELNLQRTTIASPVDGYLNDRAPRVGEFATAGRSILALVDAHSFHVDGYFEETMLSRISIGEPVDIRVMGESKPLRGHVQSIVAGIVDRDRMRGGDLLPNVNPAFSWVRLAQRIPVRIALDEVPSDMRLIAGRTATVSVRTGKRAAKTAPTPRGPASAPSPASAAGAVQ